ncbi:hypothetical protein NP493_8917g00001 [Ridgeia piscesae]|uniref:Uncharacterized protein n=1 Tax=Ridgeia piscesae TaxID=27915 RepID=A0AAD9IQB7_RIDPI|nr:hypothetical protein NP493_8917g00004 [Ridgeia piscesae]KAK2138095.1 hypothetical protein NP493_8917g00001 [Ridgeia piscesae]
MFAAIRLLQGPQQALLELVEDEASIRQRDVLIKFVIGLWCDSQNAWFMEHLGSVRGQLDPQTHPHPVSSEKIEITKVFPTEVMALSWILEQPECCVTTLE